MKKIKAGAHILADEPHNQKTKAEMLFKKSLIQ
jgi:hypothetical protein